MTATTHQDYNANIARWVEQFDNLDRPYASAMLKDLELITYSRFMAAIQEQINIICQSYKRVALFPVLELAQQNRIYAAPHASGVFNNRRRPMRRLAGSSQQISYLITRLQEISPKSIAACPTEKSMIAEKIKAIIFIDDFVGSGKRTIDFWRTFVSRKVKSWLSYNKCDVYFVSYAATSKGIRKITKTCRGIKSNEFYSTLTDSTFKNTDQVINLCNRYASHYSKHNIYGFGNTLTNVVFEWKCPNNTPPLLWTDQKWTPLFKDRNVDIETFQSLCGFKTEKLADSLWSHGQYTVACTILDKINDLPPEYINFISFLSLYAKRVSLKKIQQLLQLSTDELKEMINSSKRCRAIENNRITKFGLALLESFRRLSAPKKTISSHLGGEGLIYLPQQYKGILHHLA